MISLALVAALTAPASAQDVRVLHLSPDASAVDVFVDNAQPAAITGLNFTEGTGYVALPPGMTNVKVSPAGTTPNDAVLDVDLDLMQGRKYSAVAIDELAAIGALALVDDDRNIAPGDVRLQVVHAAAAVGDAKIRALNLKTTIGTLPFGGSTVVDVPAGELKVGLDADGDNRWDFTFDVPDLGAGIFVNVFAVTDADGAPSLVAWLPDGSTAVVEGRAVPPSGVRVLHLSADAPAVDVYVNGPDTLAVGGLGFQEGTGYVDLPAGRHTFTIAAAGGAPVTSFTERLRPNTDYTAVAFDDVANLDTAFLKTGPDGAPGTNNLRIFHAADGVGQVDLWVGGAPLLTDLDFGTSSIVEGAPAGAFTVELDATDDGIAEYTFDVPDVGDQQFLNVFAVLDAAPFLLVQLPDGGLARIDAN